MILVALNTGRFPFKLPPKCIFWKRVVFHCLEFHTIPLTYPKSYLPSLPSAQSRSTHSETQRLFRKKNVCWLLPTLFLLKVWWILMYPSNWHRSGQAMSNQLSTCFVLARSHLNKQPDTTTTLAFLRHIWLKGQLHIYCQGGLKLGKEVNFQSYHNVK